MNSQLQALPAEMLPLRQERDKATNRLHMVQDGIDRSGLDAAELARLRGEVARQRNAGQELASLKAAIGAPTQSAALDLAATVDTLKKRFEEIRERLKEQIAYTVASASEVDAEVRHLFRVLARG